MLPLSHGHGDELRDIFDFEIVGNATFYLQSVL